MSVRTRIQRRLIARQHAHCRPVTVRPPVKQAVTLPGPISHLCSVRFQTCSLLLFTVTVGASKCVYLSNSVVCRQLLETGRHDKFNKGDINMTVNNRLDLMFRECTTSQRIMWYSLFSHSRCTS